jgi:hypothetical protein
VAGHIRTSETAYLLGTLVNKGKQKGRSYDAPAMIGGSAPER